jgi:hypothetical protein
MEWIHNRGNTTLSELIHTIKSVASSLDRLEIQRQERLRATKGRFNLFTVLLKRHDEVCLHTRYLAHLLDPESFAATTDSQRPRHDLGPLFLKAFLDQVAKSALDHNDEMDRFPDLKTIDPAKVKVRREFHTNSKGNIDILLECPGWGAIAIENKIYANEQEFQIQRYSQFLETKRYENWLVLFLTLDNKKAVSDGGCRYYRISYTNTILPWVEQCLRATYAFVTINQALQQYRDVVCDLTGHRKEMDMKEIEVVVRKYPNIVKHAKDINQVISTIHEEVKKTYEDNLISELHTLRFCLGPLLIEDKIQVRRLTHLDNKELKFLGCQVQIIRDAGNEEFWVCLRSEQSGLQDEDNAKKFINDITDSGLQAVWPPSDKDCCGFSSNNRCTQRIDFKEREWPWGWYLLRYPEIFEDNELADFLNFLKTSETRSTDFLQGLAKTTAQDIEAFVKVVQKICDTRKQG